MTKPITIRATCIPSMPLFSLRRSSSSLCDQQRLPKDRVSNVSSRGWVAVCDPKHQVPGKPPQYHRKESNQCSLINSNHNRHGKLQTTVILVVQLWIQWQAQGTKDISSNHAWAQVIHISSHIRVTDHLKDMEAMERELVEMAPTLLRSSLRVLVMDLLQVI